MAIKKVVHRLNWIDYIIVSILGLSVLLGFMRGFISELLALLTWIAAFYASWLFGTRVATCFAHHIQSSEVRLAIGYGSCFIVTLILGALLHFFVKRLVQGTGISGTDRLLGMCFGIVRGTLLVTLMMFLIRFSPLKHNPWWQQSLLLPTFQSIATKLASVMPKHLEKRLHLPQIKPPPAYKSDAGTKISPAASFQSLKTLPTQNRDR